jgi:hypothetical protein
LEPEVCKDGKEEHDGAYAHGERLHAFPLLYPLHLSCPHLQESTTQAKLPVLTTPGDVVHDGHRSLKQEALLAHPVQTLQETVRVCIGKGGVSKRRMVGPTGVWAFVNAATSQRVVR